MENASKALVIAGAILVSIMIIGLGVVILNNVSGVIKGANVDKQAAQANNDPFTSVFGENVSAQSVKTLVDSIRANNITAENREGGLGYIYIVFNNAATEPTAVSKGIKTGRRYVVNTPNDYSISEKNFLAGVSGSDGTTTDASSRFAATGDDKNKGAAYYYNGYIRAIKIDEVSSSAT